MSVRIPDFTPAWPVRSAGSYVRVTSTMARGGGCADQIARKARPDLFPADDPDREPAGQGSFPLGLVRDALLRLLAPGKDAESNDAGISPGDRVAGAIAAVVEESWQEWPPESLPPVHAAVVGYLELWESLRQSGELLESRVVSDVVFTDDAGQTPVEFWAWAIHHVSLDGTRREVHLLRWRGAADVPLSESEMSLVAHVAGSGFIAEHAKWYRRFVPLAGVTQPPPAEQVRVRVVGALDSSSNIRFEGSPADALAAFSTHENEVLQRLGGGATRPSYGCASCNIRQVCAGPRRMPGLLGVAGYSARTRPLSPSMLWTHGACPRQLHLTRDLGLPRERQETSDAMRRGIQVHEWLRLAHDRGIACSRADLPEGSVDSHPPDSLAVQLSWTSDEYHLYRAYLLNHLDVCPLAQRGAHGLVSELDITIWDTDANVIFSTRPDAAYRDDAGVWTLRETKTLSPRGVPRDRTDLLARYPQVAAAVCLLADGYRPDSQPVELPGRVELELLGPDDAMVVPFDAADPATVLVARRALAERVDSWLFDTDFPIGEHPPCSSCEVARWCEARPVSTDQLHELVLPEAGAGTDWHVTVTDAVLRDIVGIVDDEEEFPF